MNGFRYTHTLLAAAALLVTAQQASAAVIAGKIKAVALDRLVLTADIGDRTVYVGERTVITLNGKKAALGELKPGHVATAEARRVGTKMVAMTVAARTAKEKAAFQPNPLSVAYQGTITKIDGKSMTLDVFNAADKKTTTFAVRKDTKVTLDGKVATFADLKPGFSVDVTAKPDAGKLVATAVIARKINLKRR